MISRKAMRGHMNEAEDVAQLLQYERDFAKGPLAHGDGLPPTAVLMSLWEKSRDLWTRVIRSMPPGPAREEMVYLLEEREEAMEAIRAKARVQLAAKLAKGDCDA
jgi:hypothetical protein